MSDRESDPSDLDFQALAFEALARAALDPLENMQAVLVVRNGSTSYIALLNASPRDAAQLAEAASRRLLQHHNIVH
jgi:tRNA A37 N6-isopentenylltransferase MiaA